MYWAQWMEHAGPSLSVGLDLVAGDVQVMTWFIGFSDEDEEPPLLWQTQVKGGSRDGLVQQYGCYDEALRGHERVLRVVTRAETRSHADGSGSRT